MKKRTLSFVLALIMLLGLFPAAAFADDGASGGAPAAAVEPVQPSVEPAQPSAEPAQPSAEPAQPSTEPAQPSEAPAPSPSASPVPGGEAGADEPGGNKDAEEDEPVEEEPEEDELLPEYELIAVYAALGAFDASLLNGIPADYDIGAGTTKWGTLNGRLVSGIAGKSYASSTLTLTFTADTYLSFEYAVSSEKGYDFFTISHNGTQLVNTSGINGGSLQLEMHNGDVLTFTYKKDSSGNENDDCAYVWNFSATEPVTVTFHANDGTDATETQGFFGPAALRLNSFTKDHGVFLGWSATPGGEVVYTDGQTIDKPEQPLALYAVWADAFVVSFDGCGSVNVIQGQPLGASAMPADPTRTGYIFSGWTCNGASFDPAVPVTGDMTCQAQWTPITYTVSFAANGGVGPAMGDCTLTYEQQLTLPECGFTRDGYTFTGWALSSGASSAQYTAGQQVSGLCAQEGGSVTLYAVWTGNRLTLTVDLNYETEGRLSTRTCVVGENFNYIYDEATGKTNYSRLPDPTRTGYIFDGWFTEAAGGTEIDAQFKFTSDSPMTIYAHWTKAVTVTFEPNGGRMWGVREKVIPAGSSLALDGYSLKPTPPSGKIFEGWFAEREGGTALTNSFVFNEDMTLYAHYRNPRYLLVFNARGGQGAMDSVYVDFDTDYDLPECGFTREGYRFVGWSTSSYSTRTVTSINREYDSWDNDDGETYTVYAVWEETTFNKAFTAISAAIKELDPVKSTGSFTLPASGTGWTAEYESSSSLMDITGGTAEVAKLPSSGSTVVKLTVTVTDTATDETETRKYTVTIYSPEAAEAENYLTEAVDSLPRSFTPDYDTDKNACTAVDKLLKDKDFTGIKVSVKEAAHDSSNFASIAADGKISYYFNPAMSGRPIPFDVPFVFSCKGASVEKSLRTTLCWDSDRVRAELRTAAGRLPVPSEISDSISLYQHTPKEDADPGEGGYDDTMFDIWNTVTWTSSDEKLIKIGTAVTWRHSAPYAVTIRPESFDKKVTLTATLVCNSMDNISYEKTFTVVVKGSETDPDKILQHELEQKLDAGLRSPGLCDIVTGDPLDTGNVVNDIRFPTPSDFGVDGKYQPVSISSSNEHVIIPPDVNNAARVSVIRPLPGEEAVDVTLTVTITDKATGVSAARDITVTVQPLDSSDIDREIALMALVKAHYFDGIKNANTDPGDITTDLHPFLEASQGDGDSIVWAYDYTSMTGQGIVPVAMDGWEATEQWRTFKSSNAKVISHENLLVTRDKEHKTVTVTSWLSSEVYGKYAEQYPNNEKFKLLYKQPVSVTLTVTGTAPSSDKPVDKGLRASFTLSDNGSVWFSTKYDDLADGTTVYDVFSRALAENGYSASGGSFVTGVTRPDGTTLSNKDRGEYSGWMYSVNGSIPNVVMTGYYVTDNANISFFYTDDYTKISGMAKTATVEDVIKLIDAIGPVTAASGDKIAAARAAYDALSLADKGRVTNRNTLFEAERAYAKLIKARQKALDIYTTTGDYILDDEDDTLSSFGSEWLIFGLARSGRDVPEEYLKAVEDYVSTHTDKRGRLSSGKSTDNSRLILALSAICVDASDFAGHDLAAALDDMDYIEKQGLSGVIYALLALDCREYELPEAAGSVKRPVSREALIEYLLDAQLDDGGWAYSGDTAEPDMTAMTLQALAGYYAEKPGTELERNVKKAVDRGVDALSAMQSTTGGFVSYGSLNSESASQIIIALTALGIDPAQDMRFVKNGLSVLDSLCSFYVDGGGFSHTSGGKRDALATAQGYCALAAYYRFTGGETALYDLTDVTPASAEKAA